MNVVMLLMAAKYLNEISPELPCGLILSADTGEEGLGNLKGIRALTSAFQKQLSAVIAFDLYRDKVYPRCIGSSRYRIEVRTEGGHSFLDFGKKNAVAELAGLVTELYQMKIPEHSRTTYNVGVMEGGTSVNTIAQEASALFEFRSDSAEALENCEEYLRQKIESRKCCDVSYRCEQVGRRPCAGETDAIQMARLTNCCVRTLQAATESNRLLQKRRPTATFLCHRIFPLSVSGSAAEEELTPGKSGWIFQRWKADLRPLWRLYAEFLFL